MPNHAFGGRIFPSQPLTQNTSLNLDITALNLVAALRIPGSFRVIFRSLERACGGHTLRAYLLI